MNINGNIKMGHVATRSEYNLRQDLEHEIALVLDQCREDRSTVCSTDRKLARREEENIKKALLEKITSAIHRA